MIIGISGVARSGKDTFFKCLNNIKSPSVFKRVAFADELKNDLSNLILNNFNIDIFNCSDEEKEIIRPIMVSYGVAARSINQNFWIDKIVNKVSSYSDARIPVLTDVRYENEQKFLKNNFDKSILVYIKRIGFGPANEEEAVNDKKLLKNIDYTVEWDSFEDSNSLVEAEPHVLKFAKEMLQYGN